MVHLWAGIDAGKAHHHCVVIDADGNRLLSQKVPNDEPAMLQLLAGVLALADGGDVVWATDLNHGGPALLIALLVGHGQDILYIPGRTVHHASKIYRGDGKTDAKDAAVIADQARMRRDLRPLRAGDETSTGLRLLTARRADKSADRVRAINRLQASCWDTSRPWSVPLITAVPKQPCCCSPDTGPRTGSAAPVRPGFTPG
ncbi:MAG: hypothetical protein NVS3B6_21030 [Pseudarthrobacter sp.]